MCGRYVLKSAPRHIREQFDIPDAWNETSRGEDWWKPRFNLAPQQEAPVVRLVDEQRHLDLLRWGLIPSWAKDATIGNRLINARSETASIKPAFRSAFRSHRCIVPADGFYEWQVTPLGKQPYYIHRRDDQLLAFAGLWSNWNPPGTEDDLQTFTILTTEANVWMRKLHDRMPVILNKEQVELWLDPTSKPEALQKVMRPVDDKSLVAYPVSRAVGNTRNDDKNLLEPVTS